MIDELVKRFVEVGESSIGARDWETYGSVFAEDLHMETSMIPKAMTGRDARIQLVKGIIDTFPDGVVEIQRYFGQGDWACVEGSLPALTPDRWQRRTGRKSLRPISQLSGPIAWL